MLKGCVDGAYHIDQVMYEWDTQTLTGKGFAQGFVNYVAREKRGNDIRYSGSVEFYLEHQEGWWSIYYFVFPGFSWNDQWPD